MTRPEESTRPEAAFVLLLLQALFWLVAAVSSAPFVLGGEVHMAALVVATLLLSLATVLLGIGVLWRRPAARRLVIALEVVCLAGTALAFLAPIGSNRGVVSVMVNAALPIAVVVLLRSGPRGAFS